MNDRSSLIIGIDGGGSKTLALLADARGAILGRGYGGCANYQSVGFPRPRRLCLTTMQYFADAGAPVQPVAALCMGIAGSDRPEDQVLYGAWAARRGRGAG